MTSLLRAILCVVLGVAAALAQTVVSARSGMIHYAEGQVLLGDQTVQSKFGSFPEIAENATLRTEEGRAEVLLTPGVFLRVGENSSVRMLSRRLIDTRLEFLAGSAVVEANEILKDNSVTVVHNEASVHLLKRGLYRFDSQPPALRVFAGEAGVRCGNRTFEVKEGRMLTLDGEPATARFDRNSTDALDRWSRRRGEYLAMANVSAANLIRTSGMSWRSSGWYWNPYFGIFTFVPMSGSWYSPYGYRYWSPGAVVRIYQPPPDYAGGGMPVGSSTGGGRGYSTMAPTSGGYSGVSASAPVSSVSSTHASSSMAASAPSAPVSSSGSSSPSGGGGASARK